MSRIRIVSSNMNAHLAIHGEIFSEKATNFSKSNFSNISQIEDCTLIEISWIRYNNIIFKSKYVIISNADENNLSFGIIKHHFEKKINFLHYI